MIINIHTIKKYKDYWTVRFTSEKNQSGIEIATPVFDDTNKLVKYIEKYINDNIPVIEEPDISVESSEIEINEPSDNSSSNDSTQLTTEEIELQNMQNDLNDLRSQKDLLANEIATLLDDWKLDTDLVTLKNDFDITDNDYLQILNDKKQRKVTKYVELKTQYENLKQQIKDKEDEITQFIDDNGLEHQI